MKHSILVLLLCSMAACTRNGQAAADVQETATSEAVEDTVDLTNDIIAFLTDFAQVEKDENGNYLCAQLSDIGDVPTDLIDGEWYMQNIAHVAKVSQQAISYLKAKDQLSALELLNSELYNFYAHPSVDTEGTFILSLSVAYLMNQCYGQDSDTTVTKQIELYEYCLFRADAVQCEWDYYHPVFLDMLGVLAHFYDKKGDAKKLALLNDICEYVKTHEEKEVGVILSLNLTNRGYLLESIEQP